MFNIKVNGDKLCKLACIGICFIMGFFMLYAIYEGNSINKELTDLNQQIEQVTNE